ncbi:MAG: hypothetical protein ISS33_02445 [Candidatus Omnitrophica bacterium]|nr:hypothetical protein [Candidatus Omnitrophota bacterium]
MPCPYEVVLSEWYGKDDNCCCVNRRSTYEVEFFFEKPGNLCLGWFFSFIGAGFCSRISRSI